MQVSEGRFLPRLLPLACGWRPPQAFAWSAFQARLCPDLS